MIDNFIKKRDNVGLVIILISLLLFLNSFRRLDFLLMTLASYLLVLSFIITLRRDKYLLLIFIGTFCIFLLNRPLIGLLTIKNWKESFDPLYLRESMSIIYVSLLTLVITDKLPKIDFFEFRKETSSLKLNNFFKNNDQRKTFIRIIKLVFVITFFCSFISNFEIFISMSGRLYEEFYLNYTSSIPWYINILSRCYIFILCFLLALNPTKKSSVILLSSNVFIQLPLLLIGQRGGFILSVLFAFVYFIIRSLQKDDKQLWITRNEIIFAIITVPLLIVLMIYINDTRHGYGFQLNNISETITSFFYKQGVTFDTNYYGVRYAESIRDLVGGKNYLFSEITGPLINNRVVESFIDLPNIPSGNSVEKALNGYWFSHILSYVSHPWYLKGFGYGTSYVTESYYTYGYVGIVIVNMFLSKTLIQMVHSYNKGTLSRFIILSISIYIFYLPRQPFASVLSFMFKPYFIMVIIGIILARLISMSKAIIRIKKFLSIQ